MQCLRQILLTCPIPVRETLIEILQYQLQVKFILNENFLKTLDSFQKLTLDLLDQCGLLQLQLTDVESFVGRSL